MKSGLFTVAVLAAMVAALQPGPARAGEFAAFAFSDSRVSWGTSWNQPSPGIAHRNALNNCGAADCTIRRDIPPGECFAVVHGDVGRVAWGWGATMAIARQAALGRCVSDGNSKCEIPKGAGSLFCNKRAAAPPPSRPRPPPRPTGPFTIFYGFDLYGGDYARLPGRVSYQDCLSGCQADSQCRAFTYNTTAAACFLKWKVNNRTPFKAAISGVRN